MGLTAQYKMGFYYDQIGIDQQSDYQRIVQAVAACQPDVRIDVSDSEKMYQTVIAVKYDNPEFCYWLSDEVKMDGDRLLLTYVTEDREEVSELIRQLRDRRKSILADLLKEAEYPSQEELLKGIFNYLAKKIVYAEEELQKPEPAPWIYDIRGVFLKEKSMCLGIALAVNYLCTALHIPVLLVTGKAKDAGWNDNHGWNMVRLGGEYYHLDVASAIKMDGDQREKYFLMKDKDLADRSWAKNIYPKSE